MGIADRSKSLKVIHLVTRRFGKAHRCEGAPETSPDANVVVDGGSNLFLFQLNLVLGTLTRL
jgi:hypothetical protein